MPLHLGHPNPTRTLRLNCSFHAMLLAWFSLIVCFGVWGTLHRGTESLAYSFATVAMLAVILGGILSILGWLIALPLVVLSVRRSDGPHAGMILLIGPAIGPLTLFLLAALDTRTNTGSSHVTIDRPLLIWLSLALAVSTLTTLLYLLLLGRQASKETNDR